ncbi:MAG: ATP-dependent Clp protease proteolytic subunit [Spirochaetaceae bacterium]|nr:MAG: ATP-dependent Clp protease proteolytic subunit [Spirochaetaceae bacterium]
MMLSVQDIYSEVQSRRVESAEDYVLKKYLKKVNKQTNRVVILYASAFTEKETAGRVLQINRQDASCFTAVSSGMESRELDLILHSPGGSVEATEQIVAYLRRRYHHIRVIVPLCALSTATLLCCAADEVLMAEHAALGPIDPLVNWSHQGGTYSATAHDIIKEYSIAQRNINNKKNDPVLWVERLNAYPPGLLATCKSQIQMCWDLAKNWLGRYMFHGEENAAQKAESVATWLSDLRGFTGSRRPISQAQAAAKGMKVDLLDTEESLLENVMAVFYAGLVKFQTGDCVKIVEDQNGKGCTVGARMFPGPM